MQCIFLSADLMFSSRVLGAAKAIGLPLKIVPVAGDVARSLSAETRLLLVDLTMPGLDVPQVVHAAREQSPAARIIAFGPHVDEEALNAAKAAGCEVLTRGKFQQGFAELLQEAQQP